MKTILKKYIEGRCNKEELEDAIHVLKSTESEGILNAFMREHWKTSALKQIDSQDEGAELTLNRIHRQININEKSDSFVKRLYIGFAKVASILILPLLMVLLYTTYSPDSMQVYEAFSTFTTPHGIQGQVELPDGTKVWLNAGSSIKYPSQFIGKASREVTLVGEGYFDVMSNEAQPFYVKTKDHFAVQVVGTSFNVTAYEEDTEVRVALVEGKVNLLRMEDNRLEVIGHLVPNQIGRFDCAEARLELKTVSEMQQYTAWKEGKMVFVNEAFEAVMRKMQRKYDVDYEIRDEKVLSRHITATFTNQNLDQFMEVLALASPIHYEVLDAEKQSDGTYGKRKVVIY